MKISSGKHTLMRFEKRISAGRSVLIVRSLSENIGRIVTDVTKVSNLAQSFLSTHRLILEGVPVTNCPNYR